jgi:hypothetical protein
MPRRGSGNVDSDFKKLVLKIMMNDTMKI